MDGAPRHLTSGTITYSPRLLKGGRIQAEWSGMSGYWLDPTNTKRFDGHNVFHLRGSYVVARRTELFARLMNVTDKLYAAQAFDGFGDIPWLASAGEYRTLYAGVRVKM
jgi:outer membrane receptor protein involved in Fe transport